MGRRSPPFDRRDQRPLRVRPKSERNYSRSAMGLPSAMGDEHVVSQARRSGHRLTHAIGSNVTRSYLRTSMLEFRRPVIASWASFVCGETGNNVAELLRPGA